MSDYLPHADPIWPPLAISVAAALIVGITYWTYQGVQRATRSKIWLLIALRLAALAVACLVLVRPGFEYQEFKTQPVSLVILLDQSKSMGVKDEDRGQARWEAMKKDWSAAISSLQSLEKSGTVRVAVHWFDGKLGPEVLPTEVEWPEAPGGDHTGILAGLDQAFERPGKEHAPLVAMILGSDGRDNVGKPAVDEVIAKLSRGPCPVYVVGFGNPGDSDLQPDLIAVTIDTPQTARIKDKMNVRGVIQAQRFGGQEVEVWLLIDGKPAKQADDPTKDVLFRLKPSQANQTIPIEMPACQLPDQPGEIRVSLHIKPMAGELTENNNEVTTYMTLTKEGLSVLYIEGKLRGWEPKDLKRALSRDERITLYMDYLYHDRGPEAEAERERLRTRLEKTVFDVFILGNVPALRFDADLMNRLEKAVDNGAGLVMIGGQESFGDGGWSLTKIEEVLPVQVNVTGQLEGGGQREIKFVPTESGLQHFVLRLDSDPARNRQWWERLQSLDGGNRLGRRKPGATELAKTSQDELLLAVQNYGKGRSAALAIDTTWRWIRPGPPHDPRDAGKPGAPSEGAEAHLRFWRQLILWLAKQEDAGKTVRIELDHRRLAAGKEQGITVQAKELTPGGAKDLAKPLENVEFTVRVINPKKTEAAVNVTPQGSEGKSRGLFLQTDETGEYEVMVAARQQEKDLGTARARFMTYRDDAEMLNRSANHGLLEQIAKGTGGDIRLHGGLKNLLDELKLESATQTTRSIKFPDWQQPNPVLQGILFFLFVALISVEWLLRRIWGLV